MAAFQEAVRADYYGRCAENGDLATLLAEGHVLLGSMTTDEVARAIVVPPDRDVLHVLPQEYTVDHRSGIRDPVVDLLLGDVINATTREDFVAAAPDVSEPQRRVELCGGCSGYTKVIDVQEPAPFPLLAIADLATIHLDQGAMSRGYRRPELFDLDAIESCLDDLETND